MRQPSGMAEVLWQLQDLREQLIIADGEQVKIERHIREMVREPANRLGRYGKGRVPLYADPAKAVQALRGLGGLPYLVNPRTRNRIKPGFLLERWERAANEAAILRSRLARLEEELETAGIGVPVVPADANVPLPERHTSSLWHSAPASPSTRLASLTRNMLTRNGYLTVGSVAGATESELRGIYNFGDGCVAETRRVLAVRGLTLADDPEVTP
jgi:hypothetical protein